jgi:hypothetical protein
MHYAARNAVSRAEQCQIIQQQKKYGTKQERCNVNKKRLEK